VAAYERLGAQDSSFLLFEQRATHMHVAAVAEFEEGPLAGPGGSIDAERLERYVASRLHLLPHYRQKLAWTPLSAQPIWVDDERFDLRYHVRRTRLPYPGDDAALKELTGRILSEHLDRDKPLWELWIVEGLAGGRFALIAKVHHCMVDGASGVNLLTTLYATSPEQRIEAPAPWRPRPPPPAFALAVDEVAERVRAPLDLARAAARALRRPGEALARLAEAGSAVREALEAGLHAPAETPLNRRIGPHRRTDWRSIDLGRVKEIRKRLDGTVNDVVLAAVAGAMRGFLAERGVRLARLHYRVVIPVNARPEGDRFRAANHVSALFLELPVDEPDPRRRFAAIQAETRRLKGSRTARGIEILTRLGDSTGLPALTRAGVRAAERLRPYNLIVTNVPGPQIPLYVLGSKLQEMRPLLPLFEGQGLGVAVMSYLGRVGWGWIADYDLVPDVGQVNEAMAHAFDELAAAAGLGGTVSAVPARRRPPCSRGTAGSPAH
jgi:WS/DGAT/MGAT family acyltransferase